MGEDRDQARCQPESVERVAEPAKTIVIAIDGCHAPERDGWHEVKVATIYPNEARCRSSGGRRILTRKGYVAVPGRTDEAGNAIWAEAVRWGALEATRCVVMGDGAPWIWNLSGEHFPGAIEIVDFYHAAEHVWDVSEALWGDRERSPRTKAWAKRYARLLRQGRVDLVLDAIRRADKAGSRTGTGDTGDVVRRNLKYFGDNRARMDYARFRRRGLPIGTGAVEGACKFVVQSRFKKPGARWSHEGLSNMLALKIMKLNNRWTELWPHLKAA